MKKKWIIPTITLASVPAIAATVISCTNQEDEVKKVNIAVKKGVTDVSVSPSQADTKKSVTITVSASQEGGKLLPETLKVYVKYAELPKVWYDTVVLDDGKSIEIVLDGQDVFADIFVDVQTK